jgi:pimeloyl-ACP methyl ester carboxylesterase/class 3 adenylate cyclase
MPTPETRYARSGDVSIAYQVAGEGPRDLIWVPGFVSHVELGWEIPFAGELRRRLASVARLIIFDKRGTGMSDRVAGAPSLEVRMDDVRAVMDAAGSERAALLGVSEGVPMSILFAASYPERVTALVFLGGFSRLTWAHDYPWGFTEEEYRKELDENLKLFGPREEAIAMLVELFGEGAASYADYYRQSASPGVIRALSAMNAEIDVRAVLPSIRAPALVLHGSEDRFVPVGSARYVAQHIPAAAFVELEGSGHIPVREQFERMWNEIERFLGQTWASGWWQAPELETLLATVLFTDIVGSTAKASELGDRGWRELLVRHHDRIRAQLARFRGLELDTAGDGFFARFDGPARAIRCACAIREVVAELGLEIRAGLHTGECELLDDKVAGIAVSIGARVASLAGPGEVLVSQTVKDLVAGSGIEFADRGVAELKGVPGEWRLYSVADS